MTKSFEEPDIKEKIRTGVFLRCEFESRSGRNGLFRAVGAYLALFAVAAGSFVAGDLFRQERRSLPKLQTQQFSTTVYRAFDKANIPYAHRSNIYAALIVRKDRCLSLEANEADNCRKIGEALGIDVK
jgi:hypothetical protein